MTILNKTIEIFHKPYSKEVMAYFVRLNNSEYIILNSNLAKSVTDKAYLELLELSANYPQQEFILLQRDKEPYMIENLKLHEMRVAL